MKDIAWVLFLFSLLFFAIGGAIEPWWPYFKNLNF